jgi:hypothetical protein
VSYRDDFLAEIERFKRLEADPRYVPQAIVQAAGLSNPLEPFLAIADELRTATAIRLGGEQSKVFLDTPVQDGQDFATWFANRPKPVGELNGNAKLTASDVATIRHLRDNEKLTLRQIASRYSVNPTAIWKIVHGVRWKEEKK